MQSFNNKVVFITGAASGIGLALSKAFASEGAMVMMSDYNAETLAPALAEVQALDARARSCVLDVRSADAMAAAVEQTRSELGEVNILVNNAGIGLGGGPRQVSAEEWRRSIDINLLGIVNGVDAFYDSLKSNGGDAHIINTCSMASFLPNPVMLTYGATKHAAVGYSESLELSLARDGIAVSALCPGFVKTNLVDSSHDFEEDGKPVELQSTAMRDIVAGGIEPEVVAKLTLDAVRNKRFYIFTDPALHDFLQQKQARINADYEACVAALADA